MVDITKIDPNMKVDASIRREGLSFYSADSAPFQVYGVKKEDGRYRRMPRAAAQAVSEGFAWGAICTAGGCVRFRTNSTRVAIIAKMDSLGRFSHMPLSGAAGFDLYSGRDYVNTFVPPLEMTGGYENTRILGDAQWRDLTINFPLYSGVLELYIGLDENAQVEAPQPYALSRPIVYYGSSITQGGCASRPGNAYPAVVSRRWNVEHLNLGVSGCAKGETAIADYISQLEMAAFVYDYDHNAPTVEHLKATHEPMFRHIRQAQPDLPILILGRPQFSPSGDQEARMEVIRATYDHALAVGDKKVWLLEGRELMALCQDEGTVDGYHPTDFGFFSMAAAVGDAIGEIFGF